MRVPVSWLTEHLDLDEAIEPHDLVEAFVRIGIEVEDVHTLNSITGPVVIGRVAEIKELTEFKKPIRYCQVDVGEFSFNTNDSADAVGGNPVANEMAADEMAADETATDETASFDTGVKTRGIICGATNFAEGDLVVVALPGAVLPGGFAIGARKTYGYVSDGMICSSRELGLGDDQSGGILVLPPATASPGDEAVSILELNDTVLELAPTPDRGYALSVRGLARELSHAFDVPFGDPANLDIPAAEGEVRPVHIEDAEACQRFVLRQVTGLDATAPTPWWMRRKLMLAGIRSISLAVDVTNYVMLELGHPLHAFNTRAIQGDLVVRRARSGEKLTTLDDVERTLDVEDVVIADDSGVISLAGVMGGAGTEIDGESTDVLIEAAHWDPASISRTARRHKLFSEAAKRFERFTDPQLCAVAVEMAARLLRRYGDGTVQSGRTDVGPGVATPTISMPINLPDRVAGVRYDRGVTVRRLEQVGCKVSIGTGEDGTAMVTVTPPSWRGDLVQAADLVEEVIRLEGYDRISSIVPTAPAGRGLTAEQRRRRSVARALAEAGYVEVLPFPFISSEIWDAFALDSADERRNTVTVRNPLEADKNQLSTSLLPNLVETLQRNVSRGFKDVSLFHIGQVVLPGEAKLQTPEVGVSSRPTDAELAALNAAIPDQPIHVAAVLCGQREQLGWWGPGRAASWTDAVQAARVVAAAAGVELTVRSAELAPWHPGRCAELLVGDVCIGHAGELHPKVVERLGLPTRTSAMELDLTAVPLADNRPAPIVSAYPPVFVDVALVADKNIPAADIADVVRDACGELLEDIRLFDQYLGEQLGADKRSLTFSLRFRAKDRTLTVDEATSARDRAVSAAGERFGAQLRA